MINTQPTKWFFCMILLLCLFYMGCGSKSKPKQNTLSNSIDTLSVSSASMLKTAIKSNRYIKLTGSVYHLAAPLEIDSIQNLSIEGTATTQIVVYGDQSAAIHINNSNNIRLDSLEISFTTNGMDIKPKSGLIDIVDATEINISNTTLYSTGGFGLTTDNVDGIYVSNANISHSTIMIFELQKTSKAHFKNCIFHENTAMIVSVLGAFTYGTKEVIFSNCSFINNSPKQEGNPAFNFMENNRNFEDQILFKHCVFRNNKGFKWYGDKIKLEACKIDSSDFINNMN